MRHNKTHTHIHTYIYVYRRMYKCRSRYLQTRRDSSEAVREGKCEWVSSGSVVIGLWVEQPINFQRRDFYSFPKRPERL